MQDPDDDWADDDERVRGGGSRSRRRLGEQILSGLFDPEGAFKRGQEMVSGVSRATREEAMRIVAVEVRRFLEQVDAVDLAQQVLEGLVVDVDLKVRFSRDRASTKVEVSKIEVERDAAPEADGDEPGAARERTPAEAALDDELDGPLE